MRATRGCDRGTIVINGDPAAAISVNAISQNRNDAGARCNNRAIPIPVSAITADCQAALTANVTTASASRSTMLLLDHVV